MKIYAVYIGNDYEGSSATNPVFKIKTDALMQANALVNKYNEQGADYKPVNETSWKDESDFICVHEMDLI